jgi:DNA-binding transcriptional ArsR family regulator
MCYLRWMSQFFHPSRDDITLTGVMTALGDPTRLAIVKTLYCSADGRNCGEAAAPFPDMARSTLSGHFRVLRESGVILTTKKGVENINVVRLDDLEARFPGLLAKVMSY